jgi:hypothetical protein
VKLAATTGTAREEVLEELYGCGHHRGGVPVFARDAVAPRLSTPIKRAEVLDHRALCKTTEGRAAGSRVLFDDRHVGNRYHHTTQPVMFGVRERETKRRGRDINPTHVSTLWCVESLRIKKIGVAERREEHPRPELPTTGSRALVSLPLWWGAAERFVQEFVRCFSLLRVDEELWMARETIAKVNPVREAAVMPCDRHGDDQTKVTRNLRPRMHGPCAGVISSRVSVSRFEMCLKTILLPNPPLEFP